MDGMGDIDRDREDVLLVVGDGVECMMMHVQVFVVGGVVGISAGAAQRDGSSADIDH